jgi:hypothetical protein
VNTALAPARRGFTSFPKVAVVFVALLVVGLVAAFIVHDRYVAYGPVASRHVPEGATAAVRFDLTHVMFYEPYRRSIAPLVDRVGARMDAPARSERLEAHGFRVAGDVREVLVALGPGAGDWAIVIGGRLPRAGLATQVAEALRQEGIPLDESGGVFSVRGSNVAFAQAQDSAFVLGSSSERVRGALPAHAGPPELSGAAGGFVFRGFREEARPAPIQEIRGSFRAGSVVAVDATVVFAGEVSEAARKQAILAVLDRLTGGDSVVAAAVERSSINVESTPGQVALRLPREAIEALAERAGAAIVPPRDR